MPAVRVAQMFARLLRRGPGHCFLIDGGIMGASFRFVKSRGNRCMGVVGPWWGLFFNFNNKKYAFKKAVAMVF